MGASSGGGRKGTKKREDMMTSLRQWEKLRQRWTDSCTNEVQMKPYWSHIETISKSYRIHIEAMSKSYRSPISKSYRSHIEAISKPYWSHIEVILKLYRSHIEAISNLMRSLLLKRYRIVYVGNEDFKKIYRDIKLIKCIRKRQMLRRWVRICRFSKRSRHCKVNTETKQSKIKV